MTSVGGLSDVGLYRRTSFVRVWIRVVVESGIGMSVFMDIGDPLSLFMGFEMWVLLRLSWKRV